MSPPPSTGSAAQAVASWPAGRRGAATVVAGFFAVLAGVAFLALALAVVTRSSVVWGVDLAWEPGVHRWALAHPAAVTAARVISDLGSPVAMDVVTLVVAAATWFRRRRRLAIAVVVARLGSLVTETAAKALLDRPRPTLPIPLATASSSSFPSGHSAGTASVIGFVVLLIALGSRSGSRRLVKTAGAAALSLFALAVPATRVVLGVHYPSDVCRRRMKTDQVPTTES